MISLYSRADTSLPRTRTQPKADRDSDKNLVEAGTNMAGAGGADSGVSDLDDLPTRLFRARADSLSPRVLSAPSKLTDSCTETATGRQS